MRNQMKGIALILFGILFGVVALSVRITELSLVGGVIGIVGLVLVFMKGED